jgi:hypothetical protein
MLQKINSDPTHKAADLHTILDSVISLEFNDEYYQSIDKFEKFKDSGVEDGVSN